MHMVYAILVVDMVVYDMQVWYGCVLSDVLIWYFCKCILYAWVLAGCKYRICILYGYENLPGLMCKHMGVIFFVLELYCVVM